MTKIPMKTFASAVLILLSAFSYGQEILSYDLNVNIDVISRKLNVKGSAKIDFNNSDSISLVLWKNTVIQSISSKETPLRYTFDTVSPSPVMYIPGGGRLVVCRPAQSNEIQSIYFEYDCDMHNLTGWAKSFSEDWIEINYYSAWFPVNNSSRKFRSRINITIDPGYTVTGSGVVNRKEDCWQMIQPWPGFDNVIIASKGLRSRVLDENNIHIETFYKDFPESGADSVLSECRFVFGLYENLFGKKDSTYMKFIISPFEGGGGYSRKNFVSMRMKQFSFYTRVGVGHEIAHFWWSNAVTTTWEDWLNEAFAEYSMLIYFRERSGQDVFNTQLNEYKKRTANTPPVWGLDRNAPQAYTVCMRKGH
jgi:hypothetical protein